MQTSLRLQSTVGPQRLCVSGLRAPLQRSGVSAIRHAGRPSLRAPARLATAVKAQLFDGFEDALANAAHSAAPSAFDHLAAALTTALFMSDIDPSIVADAADAAADATAKKGGFMSFFSDAFESFIKVIDASLDKAGVPYSYGFAIIVITVLVKVATFPLSKKQVESTLSMQALQPRVKALQAKFANDAERLQVETAKLYQTAGVNPLAGCLPTLATIPVFIGLYRALSNVADEGLLTEGFFWIPSLAGPTKLNGGLGWLVPVDGVPPLGWGQTVAYLVLPVLLIVSQYASQKIISPPQSTDPSQQQTQAILKFIPLMIGYFSLNVPAGLTLYWFTNNLITTAQQVYLRKQFTPVAEAAAEAAGPQGTIVKPREPEIPRGPTGKDLNARRSPKAGQIIDVEATDAEPRGAKFQQLKAAQGGADAEDAPLAVNNEAGMSAGERFRAIKAREASARAAAQAADGGNGNGNGAAAVEAQAEAEAAPTVVAEADTLEVPAAAPSKGMQPKGSSKGKAGGKKSGAKKK